MKTTPALAGMALALILPATAPAATLGTKRVHKRVTTKAAGTVQVYRFKARTSGRVNRLNLYLDAGNTARKVALGLYAGSRTVARRARCTVAKPRAGAWNRCSIANARVTAGRSYWLALLQPSRAKGRLRYRERRLKKGPAARLSVSRSLKRLPFTWRKRAASRRAYQASIYADQPGSAPDPAITPGLPPTGQPGAGSPPAPAPGPPSFPAGYPDASNTGVPDGTILTPTGGITVRTAGAVINAVDAPSISVEAPNVTIRNSSIGRGTQSIPILNRSTGLVIEDTTIVGRDGTGVMFNNYTARRVEVFGTENGFHVGDNTTIEDSWVHDLDTSGGAHTDGIQFSGGAGNIVIRHNTIDPVAGSSGGTSAIIMHTGGDPQNHDVWIEDNLLDGTGSSVSLYCPRQAAQRIYISRNRMARGVFGSYTDSCRVPSTATQFQDNIDHRTGSPVPGSTRSN